MVLKNPISVQKTHKDEFQQYKNIRRPLVADKQNAFKRKDDYIKDQPY